MGAYVDRKTFLAALLVTLIFFFSHDEWRWLLEPMTSDQVVYLAGSFSGSFIALYVTILLVRMYLKR